MGVKLGSHIPGRAMPMDALGDCEGVGGVLSQHDYVESTPLICDRTKSRRRILVRYRR